MRDSGLAGTTTFDPQNGHDDDSMCGGNTNSAAHELQ
jgi:hypothetical protein